jgi:transcriptional antiterminator NusG
MSEIKIKSSIFIVRTTTGQEKVVATLIEERAKKRNLRVRSILVPEGVKGYIFIEAATPYDVLQAITGLPHVRSKPAGKIDISEIEHFLAPKPVLEAVSEGDIVEITGGPFKGEKAKVVRVDESKEEVVVELFESPVPIPIKVRADFVKIVEKEE